MSNVPDDLRYSDEHEWLRVEGDTATVGVTEHAAQRMGDIVFVELPETGAVLAAGATFGVIESPKAMADLYTPASGEVIEINGHLEDHPEFVGEDPYGAGWMIKIKLSDATETQRLKDSTAYAAFIAEE